MSLLSSSSITRGTASRVVLLAALGACIPLRALAEAPALHGEFDTLFEPSGITPLGDGTLLIVEDEPRRAVRLITFVGGGAASPRVDERVLPPGDGLLSRLGLGALDDLEGVARDKTDRVYVVGSHDDMGKRRRSDRQKLLRFSVENGGMVDVSLARDLAHDLVDAYPELREAILEGKKRKREDLSIEGLAFDRRRGELLIGLRTPVLDDDAIIVRLVNPGAYVTGDAAAAFGARLTRLDLDKGGIRAMSYDDVSDRLLVVSRRESGGGGSFKLWQVSTTPDGDPDRLRLPDDVKSLADVEGLTTVDRRSGFLPGVLFVRDDGDPGKGRGGEWFAVTRASLGLPLQARR